MSKLRSTLILAVSLATATSALAGSRLHSGYDAGAGMVYAESKFGNGSVSGPVRLTRLGREVRLPGGTWEYCKRSCTETLRVSTVDFWEAQNGLGAQCGIFGCLELRYPR